MNSPVLSLQTASPPTHPWNTEQASCDLQVFSCALQVLLRWNVQRGVAVLPKASSQDHMVDNIKCLFDWRLTYDQKVCGIPKFQFLVTPGA